MTYTQILNILDTNNNKKLILLTKSIATEEDFKKMEILRSVVRNYKTDPDSVNTWCREQDQIEREEKLNNLLK